MRDAPSSAILGRLAEDGATIRTFDPVSMEQAKPLLPSGVIYCSGALEAATGADLMAAMTEWNEFCALAPGRLHRGDVG